MTRPRNRRYARANARSGARAGAQSRNERARANAARLQLVGNPESDLIGSPEREPLDDSNYIAGSMMVRVRSAPFEFIVVRTIYDISQVQIIDPQTVSGMQELTETMQRISHEGWNDVLNESPEMVVRFWHNPTEAVTDLLIARFHNAVCASGLRPTEYEYVAMVDRNQQSITIEVNLIVVCYFVKKPFNFS